MAGVYSQELFAIPAGGAATYELGGAPDGHIWVVRDIHHVNYRGVALGLTGWTLFDEVDIELAGWASPRAQTNDPRDWHGRQIVGEGTLLTLTTFDDGWSIRACGYQLTLP